MQEPSEIHPSSKVYYRPLEVAIRWCGLEQHEQEILHSMQGKRLPEPSDFPDWPTLRLNAERVYDAILNRELPCGIDGMTVQSGFSIDDARLTIRHVDLRAWMIRYYPEQRPKFLFNPAEQRVEVELEKLRTCVYTRDEELRILQDKYDAMVKAGGTKGARMAPDAPITTRAETTYLNIIGGLLKLLLGQSPSGQPYSNFRTQESVVTAMIAHCGEHMGFSERTLHAKFAEAKRKLGGE